MKQKLLTAILAVLGLCLVFLAVLYVNNDIGIPRENMISDLRCSQKIQADWITEGTASDTMAAYISYPADLSDHTFSIYVNRPGFSFGYFFRCGGSLSGVEDSIAEFTLDGFPERAFLSMNARQIARVEIDNGNALQVINLDSSRPFAIVLPVNAGTVTFYDIQGIPIPCWEHPL